MHLELTLFGRKVEFQTKLLSLRPLSPTSAAGSWWPIIRESFTGAWQKNVEVSLGTVATNPTLFACLTLIAGDIAKQCLRLVEQDANGIWNETDSPAFSPVLRKPNRYQTIVQFVEQWMFSKLSRGNTYVLKQRDNRGVVTALYVLDPLRVIPLVTTGGDVYYQINRDDLSEVSAEQITVPASEVIHDRMNAFYHPLIGMSPIFACGMAAAQGLAIQNNSQKFFANGSNPSGILTSPQEITPEQAARIKTQWEANFGGDKIGGVAVVENGVTYKPMAMTAVDSQLIDQLKWTADTICSTFHVPPYMVGIGPPPPYANVEPLLQQYLAQCIQILSVSLEKCLDEGLGLGPQFGNSYGTEFDIDDLIWMDTATRIKAAVDAIGGAGMSPNEARKKYLMLGPTPGGESVYAQQQNYSLEALAKRDAADPFAKPAPTPAPSPQMPPDQSAKTLDGLVRKQLGMAA